MAPAVMPISRAIARSEIASGPPSASNCVATALISALVSARNRARRLTGWSLTLDTLQRWTTIRRNNFKRRVVNARHVEAGFVREEKLRLGLLALTQLIVALDYNIVYVALPDIGRALGFTPQSVQWVVSAYAVGLGGLLLFGGRAVDRLGPRRL